MTELDAFREAVRSGDQDARLILPDWLEERGHHFADLLRTGQWCFVPRGTFWMGGSAGKCGHRQVSLPQDFLMGKYPVTQRQWQAVMGDNPSHFKGDDLPVECVSWNDCQEYLKQLNATAPGGLVYRLPTEEEWEYACRGAATIPEECAFDFYFDQPTNDLSSEQANFDGNYPAGVAKRGPYLSQTSPVGSYPPNRLGLCDMHGNVWEWTDSFFVEAPGFCVAAPGSTMPGSAGPPTASSSPPTTATATTTVFGSAPVSAPSFFVESPGFCVAAPGSTMPGTAGPPSATTTPPTSASASSVFGSASARRGSGRVIRSGCWGILAAFCTASVRGRFEPDIASGYLGFRLLAAFTTAAMAGCLKVEITVE